MVKEHPFPRWKIVCGGIQGWVKEWSRNIHFPDGTKYVGEWKDGKTWNGTEYDKNGNIIGKWVNGVLQK